MLTWVGHDVYRQRRLPIRTRQDHAHRAGSSAATAMDQEGVNRPIVVCVPLPPVDLLSRVFVGIFDAVDLVAQAIGFIEKGWRVSAHNLEMLSVAGQELLPIRN